MKRFKNPKDIKVGVIGYGGAFNMGRAHLQQMKGAGMTPFAVAEIDPARLKVATDDFPGIQTYSSVAEMLKKSDVNLVTIITPHNTHAPLAVQCLKAGRHVVTEKPFAVTTAECDRMIREAKANDVMVSTYHNRHWDGWIMRAVQQIKDRGVIGDIYRIEAHMGRYGMPRDWWRSNKTISGGVLYDWGAHLLEYSLQLIDANLTEVSGYARTGFWASKAAKTAPWKADPTEDEAFAAARFDNGTWLTLDISHLDSNPKRGMLEVTGTKGTYIFDTQGWETFTQGRRGVVHKTGKNLKNQGNKFYQNVAAHLTTGEKLVITPQWARRPIHILDLATRSAAQGKALKAKYA